MTDIVMTATLMPTNRSLWSRITGGSRRTGDKREAVAHASPAGSARRIAMRAQDAQELHLISL